MTSFDLADLHHLLASIAALIQITRRAEKWLRRRGRKDRQSG